MGDNPRIRPASARQGGGAARARNRSGQAPRPARAPITRISLKLDGTDAGQQYLDAIKDTPFDLHSDSAFGAESDANMPPMSWKHGDELPEHLQPEPGEAPIAVIDAGPKPWEGWTAAVADEGQHAAAACCFKHPNGVCPYAKLGVFCPYRENGPHAATIEQQTGDEPQNGDPGPELSQWPTPGQPARDPMQTAPVWGTAPREDEGQRYRSESGEGEGGRVVGRTAGFCCRLCNREATRFAMNPGDTRSRDACCDECLQGIDNVLDKMGGEAMEQENLTQMERAAVVEARKALFKSLQAQGLAERFNDATAAQMDAVIIGVWEGVRASMQKQSNTGEIPF